MFVVMSKRVFKSKQVLPLDMWSHATPESAVAHAEARARFSGVTYLVVHDGEVIYISQQGE